MVSWHQNELILLLELIKIICMDLNRAHSAKFSEQLPAHSLPTQPLYGPYGNVQVARHSKTGQVVAIKKLNHKIDPMELEIMKKIRHPNIVNLLDYFLDQKNQVTCLVLEYRESRPLFDCLKFCHTRARDLGEGVFQSVLNAVVYLHARGLYRLDIKPENILVDSSYRVKLCYFGISMGRVPRMSICRSLQYLAPQALLKLSTTHKIDNWALGILLYELIQSKTPFQGRTEQEILSSIKKPSVLSQNFNQQQITVITSLLKINPKQRLEAFQILKFPTFKQKYSKTEQVSKISTVDQLEPRQPKIKLIEIKNVDHSLQKQKQKQKQRQKQSNSIHITSIKKLIQIPNSPTTSDLMARIDKTQYSHSMYNREKISLKKYFKKDHKN